jgi:hypothetical protein
MTVSSVHQQPAAAGRRGGYVTFVSGAMLALTPVALFAFLLWYGLRNDLLALDFSQAFVPAAKAVLDGVSPYPSPSDPVVATGTAYVYPPLTALLLVPTAWLPEVVGEIAATFVNAALVFAILRVLRVRDWRCYAVAFTWPTVIAALQTANVTLVLTLGAALAWRWRDRPGRAGGALGCTIAVKMFLWPLVLSFFATRRRPAALIASASSLALIVVSWAVIGFAGMADYPSLLSRLADLESPHSYTTYALALDVGLPEGGAKALWVAIGVALLGGLVIIARRGDERAAFIIALAAALACSPIVWLHYFALLLVPVALASRRLQLVWFIPLLAWLGMGTGNGDTWQLVAVLMAVALTLARCLLPPRVRSRLDRSTARRAARGQC